MWTELLPRRPYISDHGLGIVYNAGWRTWSNQEHGPDQAEAYQRVARPRAMRFGGVGGGSNFGGAWSTDLELAEGALVDEPVGAGVTQAAVPG